MNSMQMRSQLVQVWFKKLCKLLVVILGYSVHVTF